MTPASVPQLAGVGDARFAPEDLPERLRWPNRMV